MPLIFNGTTITSLQYNGVNITSAYYNGVQVFNSTQTYTYSLDATADAIEPSGVNYGTVPYYASIISATLRLSGGRGNGYLYAGGSLIHNMTKSTTSGNITETLGAAALAQLTPGKSLQVNVEFAGLGGTPSIGCILTVTYTS